MALRRTYEHAHLTLDTRREHPFRYDGEFEFDDEYMRRGIEFMSEVIGRRYVRSMPVSIWNNRLFYGYRALMYRLRPRINVKRLHDSELRRAGLGG